MTDWNLGKNTHPTGLHTGSHVTQQSRATSFGKDFDPQDLTEEGIILATYFLAAGSWLVVAKGKCVAPDGPQYCSSQLALRAYFPNGSHVEKSATPKGRGKEQQEGEAQLDLRDIPSAKLVFSVRRLDHVPGQLVSLRLDATRL